MPPQGPLVSIVIPTLNEGEALPICLASIQSQTYPGLEVLVVDSGSGDGTREAAERAGAALVDYPGRPLGARYQGLRRSRGELVLLLDADQVLYPDSLERGVAAMDGRDMLVLEESSYRPKGLLQRSIARQKAALQSGAGSRGIPPHSYPRLYRRELLEAAYSQLPEAVLGEVFAYDDRILYSKASKASSRVGVLRRGVMHLEESSWAGMMRHSYRLGRSARRMDELGLGDEVKAPEGALQLLRRAARNRYLTYSVLKELSFRLGRALG